jgi:hypothetical protein
VTVHPGDPLSADSIDRRLHAERLAGRSGKRTHRADLAEVPDGTFVAQCGRAWLVQGSMLVAWSPAGYVSRMARPDAGRVEVLTPPSSVAVLRAGYRPHVHPTARSEAVAGPAEDVV